MLLRDIDENEFKSFTEAYPFSSIFQTVEYANVMKYEGYTVIYVGAFQNNNMIAGAMILVKKIRGFLYAYCPRGFLIDYCNNSLMADFTKMLKKFLGKKDIVAVKLCPIIVKDIYNSDGKVIGNNPNYNAIFNNLQTLGYYHFGYNSFFEAYKPRFEAMIDISQNYTDLFKNIKNEYKTKIRSAESNGIKIYKADINEISFIYDQVKGKTKKNINFIENSFKYMGNSNKIDYYYAKLDTEIYLKLTKKRFEEQDVLVNSINESILRKKESSTKTINKKIEADNTLSLYKLKLIEATNLMREYPTGLVVSTVIVTKHRSEVFLYLDGYEKKYKNLNAKHLLMWKMIEKYSNLGFKRFNLGGVTDVRLKSEKYDGLNNFKTNFNSSIMEYIGDLELITNKPLYFLFKQRVKESDLKGN
ncbi:MAG: peptidoglycan bridge formation glycyltransferase FemA/FemB family protein [Bacilli bacterium]